MQSTGVSKWRSNFDEVSLQILIRKLAFRACPQVKLVLQQDVKVFEREISESAFVVLRGRVRRSSCHAKAPRGELVFLGSGGSSLLIKASQITCQSQQFGTFMPVCLP